MKKEYLKFTKLLSSSLWLLLMVSTFIILFTSHTYAQDGSGSYVAPPTSNASAYEARDPKPEDKKYESSRLKQLGSGKWELVIYASFHPDIPEEMIEEEVCKRLEENFVRKDGSLKDGVYKSTNLQIYKT